MANVCLVLPTRLHWKAHRNEVDSGQIPWKTMHCTDLQYERGNTRDNCIYCGLGELPS